MISTDQLAEKYQIDITKPNFPVNTIRVLYLIFSETLSSEPEKASQKVLDIIPVIGSILQKRTTQRATQDDSSIGVEWQVVAPDVSKLNAIINSPVVNSTLEQIFAVSLRHQETMLSSIVSKTQNPEGDFSIQDLQNTLTLRSMDSVVYSTVICELINQPQHNLAIHYLTNLVYQINDLLDSILFAKEDIDSNNFSPFEIIRKAAGDSKSAKAIIKNVLDDLMTRKSEAIFPDKTQQLVDEFVQKLISVIGEIDTEEENVLSDDDI